MKLLLDTHMILWALDNNPKLPERVFLIRGSFLNIVKRQGMNF